MSVLAIARRLHIPHSKLFRLLNSIACASSPLPSTLLFSATFRRTLPIPHSFFFSSQSFSSQNLKDPFALLEQRIHFHEPLKCGLVESLKRAAHLPSENEVMESLDEWGSKATQNLVHSAIWELRLEWRTAFLALRWGQKWGCADDRAFELMVWILGNNRKFSIAWTMIGEMDRSSMNTRLSMLIMIDRYAAANDPVKAVQTFHRMEKFKLAPDEEAFYYLLNALCNHGNIEEAEEVMHVNKMLFPLTVDGFNIILNRWCNICVDILEAKRVWREMSKSCITPNAASYTHMISCHSKVGNLFDSLRLYDEMKKRGFTPCVEVYNSLIYVLSRENCHKEAQKIVVKMKEAGVRPDTATYNSMIGPLCEAKKLEEARSVLATMEDENLSPTRETYSAFLEGSSFEETLKILNKMTVLGLDPTEDTFLLILSNYFKLMQAENALKIWVEMREYEVVPNCAHYRVVVEGLAKCGFLAKAREYYAEMLFHGFVDDPKLKKMLKEPARGKGKRKQCVH